MVTIEELKLGNRTLEALKFLFSQITELETAISQININEIKDANTLTKEQIATLKDVKNAVEAISFDLNLKKSDFDEKKQNFDTNMSAFRNDKADFDEKKADFDSKNNTALSNFAFIASNVEKINNTSALLAEAKNVLETIKPIEQRTQAALDTIANSQAKFAELDALKSNLETLKASLEALVSTGVIDDTKVNTIQTYSSKKIEDLVKGAKDTLSADIENKTNTLTNDIKTKTDALAADIKTKTDALGNVTVNQAQSISTLDRKITSTQSSLSSFASQTSNALNQKIGISEKGTANGVASLNDLGKIPIEQLPKIDAYTKAQIDDKFALKSDISDGLKIGSYLLWSSQSVTPAGFLVCDGRSLKKSEYAELFAVIGYTYGGSGGDFNIPNFSDGKFMRSIGGKAAPLGIAQRDEFKSHTHGVGQQPGVGQSNNGGSGPFAGGNNHIQSGATGGNETRPYNMAVVVLIKAKDVKEATASEVDKTPYATEAKAGITKLKNSITGKAEDVAVTEKAVSDAIEANKGLGIGQAWQDMTAQRKKDIVYTNTTGRAIMINVSGAIDNSSEDIQLWINNALMQKSNIGNRSGYVCAVVPAGATYKITTSSNSQINPSTLVWMELR